MASRDSSPVVDLNSVRSVCERCSIQSLCLPYGLEKQDLERLDTIIERKRPLQPGDFAYRTGDPFATLYAVRSGVMKTYVLEEDGDEYRAQEVGSSIVGTGRTVQDAIIDYAERSKGGE